MEKKKNSVIKKKKPDKDEIARRGHELYERRVKRKLAREKRGRVVALDIDSSDFAVGDSALQVAERLRIRRPNALVWLERIGYRALYRSGLGRRMTGNTSQRAILPHTFDAIQMLDS